MTKTSLLVLVLLMGCGSDITDVEALYALYNMPRTICYRTDAGLWKCSMETRECDCVTVEIDKEIILANFRCENDCSTPHRVTYHQEGFIIGRDVLDADED